MTGQKPAGRWRRMTDWTGLTEPGKTAEPMGPRFLAAFAVVYFLLGVGWLFQAGMSDSAQNRYFNLIFGIVFVGLSAGYFVFWKRTKRSVPPGKS